jgi:hypothetical protein
MFPLTDVSWLGGSKKNHYRSHATDPGLEYDNNNLKNNVNLTSIMTTVSTVYNLDGLVYGVYRHFQQYFSYIVEVSFIGG